MRDKQAANGGPNSLLLRMGVKSGGCSGMSYDMAFESADPGPDDIVVDVSAAASSGVDARGLRLVSDPKSLLYLFGMELDWSDALVGGGFQFHNPNAESSCGCGKSFGV